MHLQDALDSYRGGLSRRKVFAQLVLDSIQEHPAEQVNVLDIGCGHGFDGARNFRSRLPIAPGR